MRTSICLLLLLAVACDKQPAPEPTTTGNDASTGAASSGETSSGEPGSTGPGETAGDQDLTEEFVADLRAYLVTHYMQFGADIAMAGGNTLEEAQNAVTPVLVHELTDSAEDPFGHDFEQFRVLSHPDVVFVGSDTVWFGAYVRDTGALAEIYSFE